MSAQETEIETVGFRLSPQQQQALEPGDTTMIVQCAASLLAPRPEAIKAALADAVRKHEILRTTFPRPAGVRDRQQVIHDHLAPGWREEVADLESIRADPEGLGALLAREREETFDVDRGPLLRALLLGGGDASGALLVLSAHAAIADARSLLLLLDRMLAPVADAEEPIQYADYAEWRHELIAGDDAEAVDGRAWWESDAAERPPHPRLPFGTLALERRGSPSAVPVPFSPAAARSAAEAQRVPVSALLEACWHAALSRLTGESELLGAGWLEGRGQPDLERAIGAYAQPVPIRSRIEPGTTFAEVLDQVHRSRADAARRQDYASAADYGALTRAAAAGFAHIDAGDREMAAIHPAPIVPLMLVSRSVAGGPSAELQFDGAALDPADARALAGHLAALIASAAGDPAQTVSRLTILAPEARERLIAGAAGPASGAEAATPVHRLFERQAGLTPERAAVATATGATTYGELHASSNRLANLLRAMGVGRDVRVGLCVERTPALIEAVLGILEAGGAYVPLNYEHPPARLAHQLDETAALVLVTEEALLDRLPPFAGQVVCLDRDRERIEEQPDTPPRGSSEPEDLAYVMYTSGSTGLPKGVMITHANLAHYAVPMAERLGADGSRFGVVSAISTDLGNTSIFPPLIAGGTVHLVSPEGSMEGGAFAAELGGTPLDVLKVAPSHLRALLSGGAAALPRRWLVIGGEALSWELVEEIRALSPSCRLLNHYGPTEATIGCCAYEVQEPRADAATVPIGRPLAGARAHVLDRELEPVPIGVPGELCVAGAGVAAGYIGGAGERESPFVADPFAEGRMYRTGDRARRLPDGAIEFLGRVDDQVKIHGFRVEPGEIEALLLRHPGIRQAAVLAEPDARGEARLVAYIATSANPSLEELRAHLAGSLPEYMIPAAFATLEALPFTPSGKVDRRALAAEEIGEMRREAPFVAPRDAIEEEIAAIWSELLGTDQIGVFDDFFALGGHSLLATQAIMRIRRAHADIPLRALLAAPTVAKLAEVVRGGPLDDS